MNSNQIIILNIIGNSDNHTMKSIIESNNLSLSENDFQALKDKSLMKEWKTGSLILTKSGLRVYNVMNELLDIC